jgi:hypothetical protein
VGYGKAVIIDGGVMKLEGALWPREKCWSSLSAQGPGGAGPTSQVHLHLQVQLLISAQDVENYKVIKSELDRLRTMVEKSELWVDKKGSGKGEEGEAGAAKDKKEVSRLQ